MKKKILKTGTIYVNVFSSGGIFDILSYNSPDVALSCVCNPDCYLTIAQPVTFTYIDEVER